MANEKGHIKSTVEDLVGQKEIIDDLIVAIEDIINSMDDEENEQKNNQISQQEEELFNFAGKSRTIQFYPNYNHNRNREIAGGAPKIEGFRSIKDGTAKTITPSKPESAGKKKKESKAPKETKSLPKDETNFDEIKTICDDILNGNPCGENKKPQDYITAFGCCGYLSHQGKAVFKDPTDFSQVIGALGGGGKGGADGEFDIFNMELPPELQNMVNGQKRVEEQRAKEAERAAARARGENPDAPNDKDQDFQKCPKGMRCKVDSKGNLVPDDSPPKPLGGKALMKDVSKKRDELITNEKLFNKKMNELNSRLKDALLYQKLLREGNRPKYRTDVSIHEWLMIVFGAKGAKRPVCRPCGDCCCMECIC